MDAVAQAVGALLPEGAIVSDEANTASLMLPHHTAGAPRHDWLCLSGGAIGQGLPAATGAALTCPGRKVLCLEGEGSALYTIQALWTQAREGLDVVTVIYNNRSYAILNLELNRVGAEPRGRARRRCSTSRAPTSTSSRSRAASACPRADPYVLAKLERLPRAELASLFEEAFRAKAKRRRVAEYEAQYCKPRALTPWHDAKTIWRPSQSRRAPPTRESGPGRSFR